jgi:hypothetical protein
LAVLGVLGEKCFPALSVRLRSHGIWPVEPRNPEDA